MPARGAGSSPTAALGCPCGQILAPGVPRYPRVQALPRPGVTGWGPWPGGSAVQPPQGPGVQHWQGIYRGSRGVAAFLGALSSLGVGSGGPGLGGRSGCVPRGRGWWRDRRIPGAVGALRGGPARSGAAAGAAVPPVPSAFAVTLRRARRGSVNIWRGRDGAAAPPVPSPGPPALSPPGPIPGRSRRSDKALRELRRERLRHDSGRTGRGRAPRSSSRTPPAAPRIRRPRTVRIHRGSASPVSPHPPCSPQPRIPPTPPSTLHIALRPQPRIPSCPQPPPSPPLSPQHPRARAGGSERGAPRERGLGAGQGQPRGCAGDTALGVLRLCRGAAPVLLGASCWEFRAPGQSGYGPRAWSWGGGARR